MFVEGELDRRNAAFTIFAPVAQANEHGGLRDKELPAWVNEELQDRDLSMTPAAIRALCDAVGPDLWALYNELNKIETYAQGEPVDEALVTEIVAQARETKIWDLTDAVVAGNEQKAMTSLARLLRDGEPPPLLANVIARQYRQLGVVKELREGRATEGEIARAAGVPEWKAGNISSLAGRYSWPDLRRAYTLLVDADLSVKRGQQDDESALQLLVHELCSLAPKAGLPQRRTSYAR